MATIGREHANGIFVRNPLRGGRRFCHSRNADTFGYNERGEVVFSRRGAESAEESYEYDDIGNLLNSVSAGVVTNSYTANELNQYTSILCASAPLREPTYDLDGNMLSDGTLSFTYDYAGRLETVSSNGVTHVTNFYDAKSRRVRKVTQEATTTFFYDGWNIVEERVAYTNGTATTIHYYWGKDISGSLQGAGGVGGLLYLTVDGIIYIPCYDNNGNITRYLDQNGSTVAQYTYDAFGKLIAKSGPLADFFRHRFSSKYFDPESGLYYYGYRFYNPILMRWLSRDPIDEEGGLNLYAMCENQMVFQIDAFGTTTAGEIIDSFFSFDATGPKLWVMTEDDPYTTFVRNWWPVEKRIKKIKSIVAKNSKKWARNHITTLGWKPRLGYSFDPHAGYNKLRSNPPGTDPKTARDAYAIYYFSRIQTDNLYACAIGSFRLIATVDEVSLEKCRATINIWMYNEMSKKSFGHYARHWFFKGSKMYSQYMWWNWKEHIKFNNKGEYKDENGDKASSWHGVQIDTSETWH